MAIPRRLNNTMKQIILSIILVLGFLIMWIVIPPEETLNGGGIEKITPDKVAIFKADLETHKMKPITAQEIANYFNGTGKKNTAGQVYITPAERDEFILLVNNVKHKYKISEIEGSGDPVEMLRNMLKETAVLERAERL